MGGTSMIRKFRAPFWYSWIEDQRILLLSESHQTSSVPSQEDLYSSQILQARGRHDLSFRLWCRWCRTQHDTSCSLRTNREIVLPWNLLYSDQLGQQTRATPKSRGQRSSLFWSRFGWTRLTGSRCNWDRYKTFCTVGWDLGSWAQLQRTKHHFERRVTRWSAVLESRTRIVLQDYEIFNLIPLTPRIWNGDGGRVPWEKSTQELIASIRILSGRRGSKSAYCKSGDERCAHDAQQDRHAATINTCKR